MPHQDIISGRTFWPLLLPGLRLRLRLRLRPRRTVAFGLHSMGELQFIQPILIRFAERNPEVRIVMVHTRETAGEFCEALPELGRRAVHVQKAVFQRIAFPEISLFVTSEQYDLGLDRSYSVLTFHGQPAKGITFTEEILSHFDAMFLYGPLQREALQWFLERHGLAVPATLNLFEVGYPKSDDLITGKFQAAEVRRELKLDAGKKTVLYAPAFNEGASLREFGPALIEVLAQQTQYNVIVKLPINCSYSLADKYSTGGVDWFTKVRALEEKYPNLRLSQEFLIDPLMAYADVLVTCVSSVSFEFMALNKPVIFVETPKYFSETLQQRFPGEDTTAWAERTTVNGGREFGLVVARVEGLPGAIETVLAEPGRFPRQQERLRDYLLYNPGRATEAAVSTLEALLAKKVKTLRPRTTRGILGNIGTAIFRRLKRLISSSESCE